MNKKRVLKLTETALMLALATVLSLVKIFELPYGGSITAFSMVPIMIIAFRYGTKWGMISGFVYSVIQLLFGISTLSYATSAGAAVIQHIIHRKAASQAAIFLLLTLASPPSVSRPLYQNAICNSTAEHLPEGRCSLKRFRHPSGYFPFRKSISLRL